MKIVITLDFVIHIFPLETRNALWDKTGSGESSGRNTISVFISFTV